MALCALLGLGARSLFAFEPGLLVGLLGGFVIASLMPTRGAGCGGRGTDKTDRTGTGGTDSDSTTE